MKKILVLLALVLLIGCGGSKIKLNNGTGSAIANVTLTIDGKVETWQNIDSDETFSSGLTFPEQATTILLEWETAGELSSIEYVSIDSAYKANRVSILFAPDEMGVSYEF